MKLKIVVDTKANKVVFAEAEKDFVDFLVQIMALPLSTVSKLLNEKGMVGSQGTLYKCMESLDLGYYESDSKKDLVQRPMAFVAIPLLSLNVAPASIELYTCDRHPSYFSDRRGENCHCGGKMSTEFSRTYKTPSSLDRDSGYVKEKVPYIVMDNLEVKPMSLSFIKSFFKDYDSLDEKEVQVSRDEGLAILKASLERQDVLTSVFLVASPLNSSRGPSSVVLVHEADKYSSPYA